MIEVGILKNFDSGTYKAGVQLAGSLTTYFDDVSVAKNIPSSALVTGNYVIVAIPGGNPKDAVVIAAWPQGGGSFLDLSDTPSSYSGQANKIPVVNSPENALLFAARGLELIDDHYFSAAATSYTISGLDGDKDIQYYITAFLVWNSDNTGNIMLYLNNDSANHYKRIYILADGTNVVTGGPSYMMGIPIAYSSTSGSLFFDPLMALHAVSGRNRVFFAYRHTITRWYSAIQEWENTVDNITRLDFAATEPDGIGAGSRITVWRLPRV
jgi:hypothetical protein